MSRINRYKEGDEPAFPLNSDIDRYELHAGMRLRDYFAAKAMQAQITNPRFTSPPYNETADVAYKIADAMMEARK